MESISSPEIDSPRPARWELTAIGLLLLLFFAALVFEAWRLGPTVDEPSHLLSAHLWWKGRDRLYPRDMPPVIKIVGGWPSLFLHLPVDPTLGLPGDKRTEWESAAGLFAKIPTEKLGRVLFWSRLPLTIFPLITALVLWWWGHRLFGPIPGLVVAAVWALCPTAMGHGGLFKNDHAATAMHLLFWFCAWRFWKVPTRSRVLALGAAAALAMLSKLSMFYLLPIVPAIVLARLWRTTGKAVVNAALAVVVVYGLSVIAWQFEMDPRWPVPAAAVTGIVSLFKAGADPVPVYMLGQIYPEGNRAYFLLATLLKMPFPAEALLLVTIALIICRRRTLTAADAFWLLPGLLYFGLASLSSLQLGARLVMPAWALFYLACGPATQWLLHAPVRKAALAGALAIAATLAATAYPWGISFFNPFVGGEVHALSYLADSNIDWGQSLPAAAQWLHKHKVPKVHLSYFGFDRPERSFRPGEWETLVAPWEANTPVERVQPEPGWYAISATLLPGHIFVPRYRDYYADFRARKPVAIAGGSIFIYKVD